MKCRHCNSEWNISPSISAPICTCPFCGKSLEVEKKCDTAETVISSIFQQFGEEALRNGTKMIAYFSDLAPALKRDRLMLSYLVACNGHIILLNARNAKEESPKIQIEKLVFKMTEELLIAETHSRQICNQFWAAIGGDPLPDDTAVQSKEETIPVSNQARSDSLTQKTASSPEKYNSQTPSVEPHGADFKVKGRTLVKYYGTSPNPRVPNGIRIIDKRAFAENKAIQAVTLPDTVVKIKEEAFYFCDNLRAVNFPPNLEIIQDRAFAYSGLESALLPDSLSSLGERAFSNSAIDKARIPSSIATVPAEAFKFCKKLREVELCTGVEALTDDALDYCANLKTITIPDSLVQIVAHWSWSASSPFCGTDNITSVIASDSWKKNHPEILRILIPSPNEAENFVVEQGILVHYYGRAIRPVIPTGVTKIGKGAFSNNSHIQSIVLTEGVHTIEMDAFSCCQNLRAVTFPKSLMRIGEYAFSNTGLSALVIPPNVYGVGKGAFRSCYNLKELTFPDGLINIPASAFDWCRNIEKIHASETWMSRNADLVSAIIRKR